MGTFLLGGECLRMRPSESLLVLVFSLGFVDNNKNIEYRRLYPLISLMKDFKSVLQPIKPAKKTKLISIKLSSLRLHYCCISTDLKKKKEDNVFIASQNNLLFNARTYSSTSSWFLLSHVPDIFLLFKCLIIVFLLLLCPNRLRSWCNKKHFFLVRITFWVFEQA